ncbi:MAG: DUF4330 domain-containing protein [Cyanobacteriota bacterium]|nr:DUF4330 domain-containing protein [Cyanobacteriota bacterium]
MASDPSASPTPPPGRWSPVDIAAAVAVLLAAGGVIWSPKLSNAVNKATGGVVPVTVSVDVRGEPAVDGAALIRSIEAEGQVSIVIRNAPHGTVKIARLEPLQRRLTILTPEGKLISTPDPNQKTFGTFDARFILKGEGRRGGGGVVLGNQTLKIGAPVELEGSNYRFNGNVTNLVVGAPS